MRTVHFDWEPGFVLQLTSIHVENISLYTNMIVSSFQLGSKNRTWQELKVAHRFSALAAPEARHSPIRLTCLVTQLLVTVKTWKDMARRLWWKVAISQRPAWWRLPIRSIRFKSVLQILAVWLEGLSNTLYSRTLGTNWMLSVQALHKPASPWMLPIDKT